MDPRALIGCPCETCGCPVQVCLHPETGDDALFCVTCDVFVHEDHVIDACCTATRQAPDGEHVQRCGALRGHDGPHGWVCDHPAPDGKGACGHNADDPHVEGHEYYDDDCGEPGCEALVRTWPHGFNFRCRGVLGHEGSHVADVRYIYDDVLDGYEARWVRPEPFVENVPDGHGVRYVRADEPPETCGRCGSGRASLGTPKLGVTAWRCEACAGEIQHDVLCQENGGVLVRIDGADRLDEMQDASE